MIKMDYVWSIQVIERQVNSFRQVLSKMKKEI